MKATNVEQLICSLESFDAEQSVSIGVKNGRNCIFVHDGLCIMDHIYIPESLNS